MSTYEEGENHEGTASPRQESAWKVYTDGRGNPIENEDETIRRKALEALHQQFSGSTAPRLEYTGNARAGSVSYVEGELRLEFWHEMGGGAAKLFISVPTRDAWEQQTRTPLSRRDEILHFIASTVRREQAPSWRYEIRDNEIVYF